MSHSKKPPSYRFHKARKCAVVTIHGKDRYLGSYGSPESYEKYARLIATWHATQDTPNVLVDEPTDGVVSINAIVLKYLAFAEGYYRKNGQPTDEMKNIRASVAALIKLYGRTAANAFGPKDLELVRCSMIDANLARKTINGRISRIRRMFRWASKEELVPPVTYHGLLALDGLKFNRSKARETQRVMPVADEHVAKTLPHLNLHVRTMVQVQLLTGMRPQEMRNMRTCDIDRTTDVWIYTPWTHKTEHHGHVRQIAIGPKAQKLLTPFLKPSDAELYVFTPAEAVEEVRKRRAAARKTKRQPSQLARRPKKNPRRKPAKYYERHAYGRAITRGCEEGKVPHWHPNQLRHSCGTKIRRLYGLDGAAAVLGHRLGTVTEIYAEADLQKAVEIMRAIG